MALPVAGRCLFRFCGGWNVEKVVMKHIIRWVLVVAIFSALPLVIGCGGGQSSSDDEGLAAPQEPIAIPD